MGSPSLLKSTCQVENEKRFEPHCLFQILIQCNWLFKFPEISTGKGKDVGSSSLLKSTCQVENEKRLEPHC